ncbi:hypothetical protein L484_002533 [Morus notabilis]|uniref:FLZ-type domain-containing protein n=1 Tax=Morus notabilis TaxID=981085 RepID=W9R921_9ROSA|nr:protein MARD1 [Morus notabilis]EXB76740.1 hypothetical protein L484_002533 [Morus notabilis]
MIGKLSELLVSGHRGGFLDVGTSPRSPLDLKMQSPRGLKNYDLGGVGLGIVAALDKSGDYNNKIGGDVLAKYAICSSNRNRSNPIPVNPGGDRFSVAASRGCDQEFEEESSENYTYVTCRGPNNKSFTKVYYDGGDYNGKSRKNNQSNNFGIFNLPTTRRSPEEFSAFPTSDFLSSCHLCRKKLHGKDIYMYRGEKGFCSAECRSSQIMMDERKEQQCRSEASRSVDHVVSSSSYSRGQIFSSGIVAI